MSVIYTWLYKNVDRSLLALIISLRGELLGQVTSIPPAAEASYVAFRSHSGCSEEVSRKFGV